MRLGRSWLGRNGGRRSCLECSVERHTNYHLSELRDERSQGGYRYRSPWRLQYSRSEVSKLECLTSSTSSKIESPPMRINGDRCNPAVFNAFSEATVRERCISTRGDQTPSLVALRRQHPRSRPSGLSPCRSSLPIIDGHSLLAEGLHCQ